METVLIEITKIFSSSPDPWTMIIGIIILSTVLLLKIKKFNLDASVTKSNITEKEFEVLHKQIEFLSEQLELSNQRLFAAQEEINMLREKIRNLEQYYETNKNIKNKST